MDTSDAALFSLLEVPLALAVALALAVELEPPGLVGEPVERGVLWPGVLALSVSRTWNLMPVTTLP